MINSLFMLGGCYNKNKKISILFIIGWIIYMITNYDFSLGLIFPIINSIVLLTITIAINTIKNRRINTILSIFSILIWSVTIDIICYFFYPLFSSNQNIIIYLWKGILFNYKYIFTNILAIFCINIITSVGKLLNNCFFKYKNIIIDD